MWLERLRGEQFRAFARLDWQPGPSINLVTGLNAAGKTTLLEAIYVLGRARSFRAQNLAELKAGDAGAWRLFAQFQAEAQPHRLGMEWQAGGVASRLDGSDKTRLSDLARALPLQFIDPGSGRLVGEGPGYRRSFLDWGVFHVEPRFLDAWQRYNRGLSQRNSALRRGLGVREVTAWDEELGRLAETLTQFRKQYVEALLSRVEPLAAKLLEAGNFKLGFRAGWPEEFSYRQLLEDQLEQHRRRGMTVQGPHRADLLFEVDGKPVRSDWSRGQQKMLVAALVLSQCLLLVEAGSPPPILLIDDFASELSTAFQARLAAELNRYPGQIFVTAFEDPKVFESHARMFHVEQGIKGSELRAIG